MNLKKVNVVKGWYDQVLTKELKKRLLLRKASIILIDCDLYESTAPVLDWVTDYIQQGTVIIFDD